MNSTLKSLIIFVVGAGVGSVSTYFATKKYFEFKADLEIASVKDAFEERLSQIETDNKSSVEGELEGPKEIEVKEKVRELNNKRDLTDYTKFFNKKGERLDGVGEVLRDAKEEADKTGLSEDFDPAEREGPEDDEPYTDEEDRQQTIDALDYQLNGASREAIVSDKAPYEIEPSDYELTCSNYEKQAFYWYQFDQILTDEDEEEVLDSRRLIGDILETSGFTDNDVDCIYIRNDKIMVDFEVTKLYDAFRPGN